uniref:HD domain-containing protein n=1 Tax=viral metagenome TaxID=1070528 RepID=A0A6C0ELH2_9ZZZZ
MPIIKDAIYGFIRVPKPCLAFMDTPEFERLRRIRQLGLAYFVYPGAVHTRFEHCLGVMHLAGKVADKLHDYVSPREKELLQIAGLLHDVGHVAFSHLMDYILEEKNINKDIAHHEDRSVHILKKINAEKKLLTPREVEMVAKMIKGDTRGESKPFLFEIVNNKAFGVDVDRLDYLQRDMYHTGSPCFQADYILECISVRDNCLAIRRKACPEIEMMYESRKRLLLLICRHKTVMKVEHIMRQAITRLNITGKWFEDNWLKLDDYRIHCMMEDKCPELLHKIYIRDWPHVDPDKRLMYIKHIERDEIKQQIDRVVWVE